jgi:hypothetical protein
MLSTILRRIRTASFEKEAQSVKKVSEELAFLVQ